MPSLLLLPAAWRSAGARPLLLALLLLPAHLPQGGGHRAAGPRVSEPRSPPGQGSGGLRAPPAPLAPCPAGLAPRSPGGERVLFGRDGAWCVLGAAWRSVPVLRDRRALERLRHRDAVPGKWESCGPAGVLGV